MQITSPVFEHNGLIPARYTCDGADINPALDFTDVPEKAQSLVLIMEDPDVPKTSRPDGMWDHWVLFNLPPETVHISENQTPIGSTGLNTSGATNYHGPCPPDREHRYFFKLYALDTILVLQSGASKKEVQAAVSGHILAQAELIGRYNRQ